MNNTALEHWANAQNDKIQNTPKDLHSKAFVGDRGYLHFDGRIRISRVNGSNKSNPAYHTLNSELKIAKHKFLPFLREDQRLRKYRDKGPLTVEGISRRHDQRYSTIKNRPIMYASHLDACVYSLYSFKLSRSYEEMLKKYGLQNTVLAYRPIHLADTDRNKSNIDFAKDLYENITGFNGDTGILLLDISGFFDNLNHKKVYEKWVRILGAKGTLPVDHLAIYKNITSFRYVFAHEAYKALDLNKKKLKELRQDRKSVLCSPAEFNAKIKKRKLIHKNKSGKGIPQGSPISGLLANMYMLDFDIKVKELVENVGGYYGRYSDDIVILVPPSEIRNIYQEVQELIKKDVLTISSKKTECFTYSKSTNQFKNTIKIIEPGSTLNLKKHPQYLGFMYTENGMYIRGNTLARRFRGRKAFLLEDDRWGYFSLASEKTGSPGIPKQIAKIRKKIKPAVTKAQLLRAEKNKEKRGAAASR